MKKLNFKRLLCFILAVAITVVPIPQTAITAEAGYEDGTECEFCGGYRFDDWLCDCGPHCSETSDSSDCYEAHHCKECGEAFEEDELCEICGLCEECARANQEEHCIECGEHLGDTCSECYHCTDCALEKGYHCEFCMECGMGLDPCGIHPFGNDTEAHCIQCSPTCMGCGECFGEDPSEFCFFCEKCLNCALESGTHCGICEWCYEGEMCEECFMCDECAVDEGAHCETCGIHVEEWCISGGEGTHCIDCAADFACAQCEECTQCLNLDFCEYCGLCLECCIQNAEDAGCNCGEYCIDGNGWDEHFCEECATCFDDVDACEYCGMCVDCCEQITECSSGMCVENPDYDQHFCEECNECFDNVEMCESCYDGGYGICEDCCAQLTEAEGCDHGFCTNSWEWDEHYCYSCGMCYADCGCAPIIHEHEYDDENVCIICNVHKNGTPVIARQPRDARCAVVDADDAAYLNNYVTFTIKAVGEGLSYQWYNAASGQPLTDDQTGPGGIKQCSGAKTDTFTIFVPPNACSITYSFYCVVTNEKGSTQSDTVKIDADHNFNAYTYDQSESFKVVYDRLILGDRERELSKTFYVSDTHWKTCSGCDATEGETEHRLGPWVAGKDPSMLFDGYKYKTCYDCGYQYGCVLPKLTEPHVHDFTYAYSQGNDFHWGQCICAAEDKTTMEKHTYGEWTTAIEPTISSGGTEERTCTKCGHIESRTTKPQGHVHQYYDWDYINENGYIDNDSENLPFMEPYGKTDRNYHYAYCLASGCNEYTKIAHNFGSAHWITYPTEEEDGVFYKLCGSCGYESGGTCPAGKYQIVFKDCRSNVQVARPGATVKLYPLKNYPAGKYFAGGFDITYTSDNGAYGSWTVLNYEHHNAGTEDEYWSFVMPEIPEGATWQTFWVEVIAEVCDCEDHEFVWKNVVAETCGTPGYTGDYMCKWCNYVEEAGSTVPATGEHGELYEDNSRPGSCTKRAYSGDLICTDCEKIVEKGHYTDFSHGRNISDEDKKPQYATCTENGFSLHYICEDCGKVTKQGQVIKKLGHEWTLVEKKEPTCEEMGWEEHYVCNRHNYRTGEPCGAVSLDGTTALANKQKIMIPALAHEYEKTVFKPTCTDQGYTLRTCTRCDYMEKENITEPTDHVFGNFISNGDGTKSASCRNCHYEEVKSDKKASGNLGSTISWYIDGKGTLYLQGIGVATKGPWSSLAGKIKAVVFDERIKNMAEDGLDGIGKVIPIYIYGNADLMDTLQESGFTNVVDVYEEDVTINLDASYIMLQRDEEVTIKAATSHPVKIDWYWEPEYILEGEAGASTCNIRGIDWGTDYLVASVALGDRTISARCRVDVTEERPALTIGAAHLAETGATSNIYSRNYAEFDVCFDMKQNLPDLTVMSGSALDAGAEEDAEAFTDHGVSVDKAWFTDETVAALFRLKVKDDKTLQVVPLMDLEDAAAVKAIKGSYKSTVTVVVNDQTYITDEQFTLKTVKSLPKVKVNGIKLNSFYSEANLPLVFDSPNGKVVSIEIDESKATDKTPAIPEWLNLNDDMTVELKPGFIGKASGSLYLKVQLKEWRVPVQVKVAVSAANNAPKLKLSANKMTVCSERGAATGTWFTLLSGNKNVPYDTIGVTAVAMADISGLSEKEQNTYAANPNYRVASVDLATGAFTVDVAPGKEAVGGKILLAVSVAGSEQTVKLPVTVSVYQKSPSFKLEKSSVTLSTHYAVTSNKITLKVLPVPGDYFLNSDNFTWTLTDSKGTALSYDKLDVSFENNKVTVGANENTATGKYKVNFFLEGVEKPVVLNVTVKEPVLNLSSKSVTLNKRLDDGAVVTLKTTPGDYELVEDNISWQVLSSKGNTFENAPLTITRTGKTVDISVNEYTGYGESYKVVFKSSETAKTATLTVKILAEGKSEAKLTLSTKGKLETGYLQKTVTIKTKWSNLAESVDITDNIKVYATAKAKNSVPVDVTDKFTVTGNEDGTYSLGFKDFASMEELNLSDKYTVTAEGISVNSLLVANTKAVKVNVTSTKAKVVQNVKNINLYRNDIYSQGEIKLSLADKEMAKITFVRIADGKYSGYYDLQDLGGGVYAIGYLDDKINPGIKDGSISLEIYLEGNNPIYKKPNAKISVKVKNVKFAK